MIDVQALTLLRGGKQLLTSFSMAMQAGDVVVILGPNGAGKSTLLQALSGLYASKKGEIILHGKSLPSYSQRQLSKLMAWQGELPPTEFGLTVEQRLALAGHGEGAIDQALSYMELAALKARALGELSSGERQRVELAALMVRSCPVWLMDEPTTHLDMRHQVDCLALIKREAKKGRLIITVLHDLQQAVAVADKVVVLDGLGGIQAGRAEALLTAEYLAPIFKVKLQGKGRNLMPVYSGDYDEET